MLGMGTKRKGKEQQRSEGAGLAWWHQEKKGKVVAYGATIAFTNVTNPANRLLLDIDVKAGR